MVKAADKVHHIEVGLISPNPWQVERRGDTTALEELADSILQHGMVETPPARMKDGHVELASGHRRLAAHKILVERGHQEFSTLRLLIRDLSDEQMADVVIQENKRRLDIDPIAEAGFYRRYMEEFKVNQTALAKRVGYSQGEIANTLRLLELPEEVQTMIISREITPRHGREILRASRWPRAQAAVLKKLKERPATVEELHNFVDGEVIAGASGLEGDGYPRPTFDTAGCDKCPDRFVGRRGPFGDKRAYCIKTECWDAKQEEARVAKIAEHVAAGQGDVLENLDYGNYESLENNDKSLVNPEECQGCEHHKKMRSYGDQAREVCINLKCFRAKKAKKTRADNEQARRGELEFQGKIDAALELANYEGRQCQLLTLEVLLRFGWREVSKWFEQTYQVTDKAKGVAVVDQLPTLLKHKTDEELRRMLPRVAFEVLRTNWSRVDRTKHYLREMEGGPSHITLKHPDGTETEKAIEEVYVAKWHGTYGGDPKGYTAYYTFEGGTGCCPITKETFDELKELGIKTDWDYSFKPPEESEAEGDPDGGEEAA